MKRFDVACLGEALVDLLPSRTGPLAQVPSFERHAGGAPANVAVGVARLGGRSAFIGTVGDDPFGEFLQSFLRAEGVDVSWLHRAKGPRTGVAFVSLDETGQPSFFSAGRGGAELALTREQAAAFPVEESVIFHLGTYALSSDSVRAVAFDLLKRARSAGVTIALDPNLRLHLWNDRSALEALVSELVPLADVAKLSSDECEFVTGTRDPKAAAQRLIEAGTALAVVTTGRDGCVYARRGETGHVPGRLAKVVDTTGAGDGFMAALLTGLARHSPAELDRGSLERLLAVAVEAGARVCEHVGAMAGLPRASELALL